MGARRGRNVGGRRAGGRWSLIPDVEEGFLENDFMERKHGGAPKLLKL